MPVSGDDPGRDTLYETIYSNGRLIAEGAHLYKQILASDLRPGEILDQAGYQVTEMGSDINGSMAWAHTNVWAGGQLLATYSAITDTNNQPDAALHFYLNDWLGTRRVPTRLCRDPATMTAPACPSAISLSCTQSIQGPVGTAIARLTGC